MRILLNKICSSSHSPLSVLDNNNIILLPGEGRHLSLGDREGTVGGRGDWKEGQGVGNSGRGMDMPSPASRKKKGKSQHALLAPTALRFGVEGGRLFVFAARVFSFCFVF